MDAQAYAAGRDDAVEHAQAGNAAQGQSHDGGTGAGQARAQAPAAGPLHGQSLRSAGTFVSTFATMIAPNRDATSLFGSGTLLCGLKTQLSRFRSRRCIPMVQLFNLAHKFKSN